MWFDIFSFFGFITYIYFTIISHFLHSTYRINVRCGKKNLGEKKTNYKSTHTKERNIECLTWNECVCLRGFLVVSQLVTMCTTYTVTSVTLRIEIKVKHLMEWFEQFLLSIAEQVDINFLLFVLWKENQTYVIIIICWIYIRHSYNLSIWLDYTHHTWIFGKKNIVVLVIKWLIIALEYHPLRY